MTDQTFRKQEPNLKALTSGNWSAKQKFYVAYYGLFSKASQAVTQAGEDVPQNVRSAARQEVKRYNRNLWMAHLSGDAAYLPV